MNKKIIYTLPSGIIAVVTPTGEIPIEEVARKDVPAGVGYKIIDASDIPTDGTFRDAWEMSSSNFDGFGIGANAWFIEKIQQEIEDTNNLQAPQKPEDVSDEDYAQSVAEFESLKSSRIEWLNKHIAIQQAEMAA